MIDGVNADPTSATGIPTRHAADLAYSAEELVEYPRRSWFSAWGRAAVMLGVAAVVALGVAAVGALVSRHREEPAQSWPTWASPVPYTSPVVLPTVTSTVTAAPPVAGPPARSPTAAAPAPDAEFLAALRRAKINIDDPSKALFGAQWVCGQFRRGFTREDIATSVRGGNPNLTELGAADYVADAAQFYCPEFGAQ